MKEIKEEIQPKKLAYTTKNIFKKELLEDNWSIRYKNKGWFMKNFEKICIIVFTIIIVILSVQLYLTDEEYREQRNLASQRAIAIENGIETNKIREQYITKLKVDIEDLNSTIASKDVEIKRLGGVVSEKDKTISTKDTVINTKTTQIKACNTDLNTEKVTSSILANWAVKFRALGYRYNVAFNKYNDYVISYVSTTYYQDLYLQTVVNEFNRVVTEVNNLVDSIE